MGGWRGGKLAGKKEMELGREVDKKRGRGVGVGGYERS